MKYYLVENREVKRLNDFKLIFTDDALYIGFKIKKQELLNVLPPRATLDGIRCYICSGFSEYTQEAMSVDDHMLSDDYIYSYACIRIQDITEELMEGSMPFILRYVIGEGEAITTVYNTVPFVIPYEGLNDETMHNSLAYYELLEALSDRVENVELLDVDFYAAEIDIVDVINFQTKLQKMAQLTHTSSKKINCIINDTTYGGPAFTIDTRDYTSDTPELIEIHAGSVIKITSNSIEYLYGDPSLLPFKVRWIQGDPHTTPRVSKEGIYFAVKELIDSQQTS